MSCKSKRTSSSDDTNVKTLYVSVMKSKFPNFITSNHLRKHFAKFEDDIVSAIIVRDQDTKESKGYGFVTFSSHEATVRAFHKLKGTKLSDKFLLYINYYKKDDSSETSTTPHQSSELYFRAMKSKLPGYINKKHILEHFAEFEAFITSAVVVRDSDTKISKGFGFVRFSSEYIAGVAQEKLHGSMLQGKFALHVEFRRSSSSARSTTKPVIHPLQMQMQNSKTFQLRPEAVSLAGLQSAFQRIGTLNRTRIEKKAGHAIVIFGYSMEDIECCWEEVRKFVEHNLTVTKSIELSTECANFLQTKCASYLQELRKQCEILLAPNLASNKKVVITLRGKTNSTKDVFDKLKKFSSKCYTEEFTLQCPKQCARVWDKCWGRFKTETERMPNIQVNFVTTNEAETEAGTSIVTVTIVGTKKATVEDLKLKVLQDENSSIMSKQSFLLPSEQFEFILKNFDSLQLKLEETYSTVLILNKKTNAVQLQAPSKLKESLITAKQEVMKFAEKCIDSQTIVTEFCFEDMVVGLLLTSTPQYYDEIKKESVKRSVIAQIQKKPKISLHLRGSRRDVESVKQKVELLSKSAEKNINQTQLMVTTKSYHLICSDEFSRYYEQLQEKMNVRITYPCQTSVLRLQLLQTSSKHVISLQLCVGNIKSEEVDCLVLDPDHISDHVVEKLFLQHVIKNGYPKVGDANFFSECSSLPCQNIIFTRLPKWSHATNQQHTRLEVVSSFQNALTCAISKRAGSIAFPLSEISEKIPESISLTVLLFLVDQLCESRPELSIHNVRVVVDSKLSADCMAAFDSFVQNNLKHTLRRKDSLLPLKHTGSFPSTMKWSWRDDKKLYTPYSPDIANKLAKAKHSDPTGKCYFYVDKKSYMVDFSTMKQKNLHTGFERNVQCTTSPTFNKGLMESANSAAANNETKVKWYYMDDKKVLTAYTEAHSDIIEKIYTRIIPKETKVIINMRRYTFDFTRMKQVNSETLHSRSIERKVILSEPEPASKQKTKESEMLPTSSDKDLVITIRGPDKNLTQAKRLVEMKLKEMLFVAKISLPLMTSNHLQQKLHVIIRKHSVEYRIRGDSKIEVGSHHKPNKVLEIEGLENAVNKAVTEIQAEIIKFHSESPSTASAAIEYPPEWEPQTKTTELFELSIVSTERQRVKAKVKETLPNARIISIKRVQNKWLWERYEQGKKRMEVKNAGITNEKLLFHGSRKTAAENIFDSEEGFDTRFSSEGMWGYANYFATKASYSHRYAYTLQDGSKELLLAKVLTGDSYTSQPNSSLKMPPEKMATSDSKVQLKQLRYDTVNGEAKGTKVFMTYSNDKAYPAYVIVYTITDAPTISTQLQFQSFTQSNPYKYI